MVPEPLRGCNTQGKYYYFFTRWLKFPTIFQWYTPFLRRENICLVARKGFRLASVYEKTLGDTHITISLPSHWSSSSTLTLLVAPILLALMGKGVLTTRTPVSSPLCYFIGTIGLRNNYTLGFWPMPHNWSLWFRVFPLTQISTYDNLSKHKPKRPRILLWVFLLYCFTYPWYTGHEVYQGIESREIWAEVGGAQGGAGSYRWGLFTRER